MAEEVSFFQKWRSYRPSKAVWLWSCIGSGVATIIVGFGWGGWVTGASATQMADQAADHARVQLATAYCVNHVTSSPDSADDLAKLRKTNSWDRGGFVKTAGWVTLPGTSAPISEAADLCASQLMNVKTAQSKVPPVAK